jgi:anaerobic magnesium-protoporphyrin IX monomethyl ester cyclase
MDERPQFNKMMLMFPPGKVYVYADGTPSSRKHCSPPIGIAYLAASLIHRGYDAACLDILVEGYEHEEYCEPFIVYGLPTEEVISRIRAEQPDVIGFSVMFSMVAAEVYEIAAAVKNAFPDIPILFGGQHATGAPKDVMDHDFVDFVLLGEADNSIVDLMDALNGRRPFESIQGLYFRNEAGEVENTMVGVKPAVEGLEWNYYDRKSSGVPTDLDGLPYPA